MPELPEIEVARRRIEPHLIGRLIRRVETTQPSYFFLTPPARLRRRLPGRRFRGLERHGKYLVGRLDDGRSLLLHLGMTGQLFAASARSRRLLGAAQRRHPARGGADGATFRPDRHTHLRLYFEDPGPAVFLRDVRKLGKVRLLERGESDPRLDRLGADALGVEAGELRRLGRRRRVAVKSLLLDQSVLAGVGNIYADEALFLAGVRPGRRSSRLGRAEWERLAGSLRRVLERALEAGGSSIRDYFAPDGQDGAYQDERLVYARTGEPCSRCSSPIRRQVIGQRGSHYCPRCQR